MNPSHLFTPTHFFRNQSKSAVYPVMVKTKTTTTRTIIIVPIIIIIIIENIRK